MLREIKEVTREFLEESEQKPIRIISHFDTDGITSASILIKTFQRLDKKFTLRIVKGLDKEIIDEELKRHSHEVLIFTDLASGSLEYFKEIKAKIFILDHHEISNEFLNDNIKIINPHLLDNFEENNCSSAGIAYLFSREISYDNLDLSSLAIIGLIGDRQEFSKSRINKEILEDSKDLTIKRGLVLYPATRPLKRALEHSISPYLPGITGNPQGVSELLEETKIDGGKSLLELEEEEMSRLITAIMVRRARVKSSEEIVGNLYLLKFFNKKEDVREISVLINACSRMGRSDIALAYCLGNEIAKSKAIDLYNQYRQELVSGIKTFENIHKIDGKGFVIMNAKDRIKDAIVGTICSMLSSSPTYEEGTILIGMAYNQDKIKVSLRIVGRKGKNLREVLERAVIDFKKKNPESPVEMGGHANAAGCMFEKEKEGEFIETLKKNLEVELIKI